MVHTPESNLDRLKCMVDQHGLDEVISLLSAVCTIQEDEADYRQQGPTSKDWRQAGERLEALAVKLESKFSK